MCAKKYVCAKACPVACHGPSVRPPTPRRLLQRPSPAAVIRSERSRWSSNALVASHAHALAHTHSSSKISASSSAVSTTAPLLPCHARPAPALLRLRSQMRCYASSPNPRIIPSQSPSEPAGRGHLQCYSTSNIATRCDD